MRALKKYRIPPFDYNAEGGVKAEESRGFKSDHSSLEAELEAGLDPSELWAPGGVKKALSLSQAARLAALGPETLCRAIVLNSRAQPVLTCLTGADVLDSTSRRIKSRHNLAAEALEGAAATVHFVLHTAGKPRVAYSRFSITQC